MQSIVLPAIPIKLYRRFAVFTLVMTALMAMLITVEPGSARPEKAETAAAPVAEKPADGQFRGAVLNRKSRPATFSNGDWDSAERDASFGRPTVSPRKTRANTSGGALPTAGLPQEYLDTLTPEEREALLQKLQNEGLLSPQALRQQASTIKSQSLRRSGSPNRNRD